ncbi:MAG TPA: TonB-dependent receptor plug domain-containing protein, partial [Gemmatimonadales bacterium]|nr:TonB-dependent receptor plug domain-containing protein [Gemmatimonadales bacterium]
MTRTRGMPLIAALLLAVPAAAVGQQPVTVQGKVTSTDGTPVAGASVVMATLGLSANTRPDGSYVILVPATRAGGTGVAILARAINYKPVSAQIDLDKPQVEQNFALAPNPLQLGEIVITGAGTTSELEKIGNVRNSVDSTLIQRSNEASVVNALSAKAPNVEVTSASGDPGASASIRIRGANTLGGTGEPLFVVDGVPVDNSVATTASLDPQTGGPQGGVSSPNRVADINPDDIESIEILKGAAAGAVYGARAGQGVILITTKKGHAGATQYSLRTSMEVNNVTKLPALQRSYGQGDGGVADPCAVPATSTPDCYASENSWGPLLAPGTKTYDHAGELYQTGVGTDNTLTISGGNDRTTFYLSGSILNQNGELPGPNNSFNRKSIRLKGDHQVSNTLKIGGNIFYANSQQYAVQKGFNFSGITWGAWRTPPEFNNIQDVTTTPDAVQRSFRFPDPSFGNEDSTRGYDNPLWSAENALSSSIVGRTVGNVSFDYTPLGWLKVNETLGLDDAQDSRVQGQPPSSSNTPDPRGQVIKQTLVNTQIDHNLVATASYTVNPDIAGTFTLGNNVNTRSFRQQGQVGNGLIADQPFNLSNASTFYAPQDFETKIRTVGFFGQATVDLWKQLYLKGG